MGTRILKAHGLPPNRIKDVSKARGLSIRQLAKEARISSSEMDRIVSGHEQPTINQIMSICGVLNVNSYEIFGLKFDKKFIADFDDVLLGSATIWLAEACKRYKVALSKPEYSQWASFIHKEAVARRLNGVETQELANTVIKILEQVKKTKALH